MKKIIAYTLFSLLFCSTIAVSTPHIIEQTKMIDEILSNSEYLHTVFVEVGTSQNCQKCDPWGQSIYEAYNSGDYDFEYVEMIEFDHNGKILNDEANAWANNYSIGAYPTSIFDGDYERIVGNYPSSLPGSLDSCGSRDVADITAVMTVFWLGDATIKVEITIKNNEQTKYDGHIRACITEIVSRYDTYEGNPYHFGFLDYAFNKGVAINAGDTYTDSMTWNGNEHQDNHGDDFGDIEADNIQVTMGILNSNNGFVDETVMARITPNNPPNPPSNPSPSDGAVNVDVNTDLTWSCSDPDGGFLKYDVYFGTTNPPPQVAWKQTGKIYDSGTMDFNTTYYWKIIAWDNHDASTSGPVWSFLVKEKQTDNQPPNIDIDKPQKAVYINNIKILPRLFGIPIIIGKVIIEANAQDEDSGIEKVEFYINGKFKGEDHTEPYTYEWRWDRLRINHLFIIKAKAYDNSGKTSFDWIIVKKYL